MAPPRIDELTIAKIKKAYFNGEGSLSALAKQYGVSDRTLKRYASAQDWGALKQARGTIVEAAITERIQNIPTGGFNPDALLVAAIEDLATSAAGAPVRSKEGAAAALARLIEAYFKRHPTTTAELVDMAIALPDFDPREFAAELKRRLDKSA